MGRKAEEREKRDQRNKKVYYAVRTTLVMALAVDFIVIFAGLVTSNTNLVVYSFIIGMILAAPVGWMSAGRTKDIERESSMPWWF